MLTGRIVASDAAAERRRAQELQVHDDHGVATASTVTGAAAGVQQLIAH